jgi:hypothetical protein
MHTHSCTQHTRHTEFWERYVRWLEGKGMEAEAQGALQRELEVFCKTRPEAHLFGARFEEQHGRVQVRQPCIFC